MDEIPNHLHYKYKGRKCQITDYLECRLEYRGPSALAQAYTSHIWCSGPSVSITVVVQFCNIITIATISNSVMSSILLTQAQMSRVKSLVLVSMSESAVATLYLGIVQTLIQSLRYSLKNFKHFPLKDEQASNNTRAMMKKQIGRIHSIFSHGGP